MYSSIHITPIDETYQHLQETIFKLQLTGLQQTNSTNHHKIYKTTTVNQLEYVEVYAAQETALHFG